MFEPSQPQIIAQPAVWVSEKVQLGGISAVNLKVEDAYGTHAKRDWIATLMSAAGARAGVAVALGRGERLALAVGVGCGVIAADGLAIATSEGELDAPTGW